MGGVSQAVKSITHDISSGVGNVLQAPAKAFAAATTPKPATPSVVNNYYTNPAGQQVEAPQGASASDIAAYNAQISAAQQLGNQGNLAAQSQLQSMGEQQRSQDALTASNRASSMGAYGQGVIGGGGYNPITAQRMGMASVGVNPAAGAYSQQLQSQRPITNQIGSSSNQFTMPDTSKVFGGN